jgi:hypothetical protein
VSQGEQAYFDVLDHPEKMPTSADYARRDRTKSTGGFDGAIGRVFWERFGEEIVTAWRTHEARRQAPREDRRRHVDACVTPPSTGCGA